MNTHTTQTLNFTANASVKTSKASRYMKALCNHFNRKVEASYDDVNGRIKFPFGDCTLTATENGLEIHVIAENEEDFARVKSVVDSHLVRFGTNETLVVNWE